MARCTIALQHCQTSNRRSEAPAADATKLNTNVVIVCALSYLLTQITNWPWSLLCNSSDTISCKSIPWPLPMGYSHPLGVYIWPGMVCAGSNTTIVSLLVAITGRYIYSHHIMQRLYLYVLKAVTLREHKPLALALSFAVFLASWLKLLVKSPVI